MNERLSESITLTAIPDNRRRSYPNPFAGRHYPGELTLWGVRPDATGINLRPG